MEERLLPINITKARVVSINLVYNDDGITFNANVGLISEYNKPITSMYVGNGNWDKTNNAELSLQTISLANELRQEIEVSVIRFMNSKQNVIEHKE